MGRTSRKRRRRGKTVQITSVKVEDKFFLFIKWLLSEGWRPACKLKMHTFPQTGRGLMAVELISTDTVLVRIPAHLLITLKTVSESHLGDIIKACGGRFSTQQLLALFLIWEQHIDRDSFWYWYISTLPQSYTSPLFVNQLSMAKFPNFIKERLCDMKDDVKKLQESFYNFFRGKICHHCKRYLTGIFNEEIFKWAWFTVNSRSVYMNPEKNFRHDFRLIDENSFALAPYLDMFNHSDDAKVNASFNSADSNYEIKSLVQYNQNDEVFVHYGDLSNLKLYLEYGFILNNNKNDLVLFNDCDFSNDKFECSEHEYKWKMNYLMSNKFFCDLYCTIEGLSWNMYVLCYVFTSRFVLDSELNKKIYSCAFTNADWLNISKLGKILIGHKLREYQKYFWDIDNNCKTAGNCDEIVIIGCNLLKEHINILLLCQDGLDIKCQEL